VRRLTARRDAAPTQIVDVLSIAGGGEAGTPTPTPSWRPVIGSPVAGTSLHDSTSLGV